MPTVDATDRIFVAVLCLGISDVLRYP